MPLDPATFLTLAPACAPAVAPTTLLAIAQVESGLDPLAIGVNGEREGKLHARSAAEAARRAEALIAAGRDIDLGLAQINVRNLHRLSLTVSEAFDPCRNLAASAAVLQGDYRSARATGAAAQAALRSALSRYNTGDPLRGFRNGYVARVEHSAAQLPATRIADRAAPAEPPSPPSWDVFGDVRSTAFVISPPASSQGDQP